MPRISDIKETKKGRYALFCDGEFLFSLDDETYFKSSLSAGDEVTDEQLSDLRRQSDIQKARDKAFSYLDIRAHTERELYEKLLRRYDPDTARDTVEFVKRLGYIDDAAAARSYARELCGVRLYSVRRAALYMREKGIDRELIDEALSAYADCEPDTLRAVIDKKYKNADAKKAFAALMRLGFDYKDIRDALSAEDYES